MQDFQKRVETNRRNDYRISMDEELNGYIESIVFAEPENGLTVARLKKPNQKETICIVGVLPSIQPGETIRCHGSWKLHPQFGKQFEVRRFDLCSPSDLNGIQKYLESGMIRGIGPVYAARIVTTFGLETLEIIDATPERLREVEGIGRVRCEQIQSCWKEQRAVRDVMIFLRTHGVSPAFAQKIYKTYGDQSIAKVKANPYAMAQEIFGIGFKSADKIAEGLGIARDAAIRIEAGISHALWELSQEGNVCYPKPDLCQLVEEMLQVDGNLIEEALERQVTAGALIHERELVWVKPLYLAEDRIACELQRILRSTGALRSVNCEKAVEWVQEKLQITLAKEQIEAVSYALKQKGLIVTGGPGTGKSTITKAILAITEKLTDKILLAAPTGKAAKRMTEITKKRATTLHSLLEVNFKGGGFKRNGTNPLECDLLIVDEASMIDTLLMSSLLKAIPSHARLILIGDTDQLPSVGPGNVLKDLITSNTIPVVQLKEIFRQAASSRIVTNAHKINQGIVPDLTRDLKSDFFFLQKDEPEAIIQEILTLVKERLCKTYHFDRVRDIQILAPMRRGLIGTENLNQVLQEALNPSATPLYRMGCRFHTHDKVMQIRNNYNKDIYNGDVGSITEINFVQQELVVLFDGRAVTYDFSEVDELTLAYAVSIHKYQGSESPCIIIPIHTSHYKLLNRNLLYTGITRGKKLVILVGSTQAIEIAVSNDEVKKRHTGLRESLLDSATDRRF